MSELTRHHRLFAGLLLAWAFAATTARALRGPNDFALAHWLLDWRLGPLKRGLPGSLLALATGGAPDQAAATAAAWCVFAASTAALLYALWQLSGRGRDTGGTLVALVVAGSPLVVMHAHLVGYFDGVVIALVVPAIALALRGRAAAGSLLLAVAVAAHEMTLLVALPAFLLAVRGGGGGAPQVGGAAREGVDWRRAAAPSLAVFGLMGVAQALQPPGALQGAVAARLAAQPGLDPVIAASLPGWLTDSFLENLRQCAGGAWERALWAVAPLLVAPALLALLWHARPAWRTRGGAAVFLVACALPQAAQLFAWDAPRIWTWSLLAAVLGAWVVRATARPAQGGAGVAERPFARPVRLSLVAVMLLDLVLTIPLMDSQADRLPIAARLLLHLPVVAGAAALAWGGCRGAAAAAAPDR